MRPLLSSVRHALSAIRQAPGFHALLLGILGLGIAASVSVFSLVDGVLLRPLPYLAPERLVALETVATKPPFDSNGSFTYDDFVALRAGAHSFEDMAVTYRVGFGEQALTQDGEREQIRAGFVSPNFFALFGRAPLLGRLFTPEENLRAEHVLIAGEGLASRRFGTAGAALGRELDMAGVKWRIIGVLAADFRAPFLDTQVWAPVRSHPEWIDKDEPNAQRSSQRWDIMARLKPDVRLAAAQAEVDTLYERLRPTDPDAHSDRALVTPLREHFTGAAQRPLQILSAAVALLLLIACANAGNLLLARGAGRQREFSIRTALGAGTARLLRQVLAETVTVCVLAGMLGAALSLELVRLLKSFAPADTPRLDEVRVDWRVLAFALALSALTGVCLGIASVWKSLRGPSADLLTAAARSTGTRKSRRWKSALVVSEFALAMVLLTGAGLLVRSFAAVMRVDLGFQPRRILILGLNVPAAAAQLPQFYRQAFDRIRALPGVEAAGATSSIFQLGVTRTHALRIVEGRPPEPKEAWQTLEWQRVSGDYFQALGIPLLRGRYFDARDSADAPPVVIVNQSLARRYWPGEDPIGKRLKGMDPRGPNYGKNDDWLTVVGLVQDMRAGGRERNPFSQIYEPQTQRLEPTNSFVVRVAGDPAQLASAVRGAVREINRDATVSSVSTMEREIDRQETGRRFQTWLIGVFSAIALLLAALGVFAVMHFTVAAKTREIGIRMAVGARASNVLALVIGDGARLAAMGIAAGALASTWVTGILSGLLFGVTPDDPVSFGGAAALLAAVAIAACWLPARRAARLNPVVALREE